MSEQQINDGGQAFPVPETQWRAAVQGMSLRDYFAAHAPAMPTFSFDVPMPTQRPTFTGYPSDLTREEASWPSDPCFDAPSERVEKIRDERAEFYAAGNAWDREYHLRRLGMWPWVWADLVLAERARRSQP